MKRRIITILFIFICFFLQGSLFQHLTFAGIRPNLLVIVTASFGFMRGQKEGMFVGVLSGLLADLFWGYALGFNILLFAVIGYLNGMFERLFYDDDIKLPIGLIGASELFYGVITYISMCMLQGNFAFGTFLMHIIGACIHHPGDPGPVSGDPACQ